MIDASAGIDMATAMLAARINCIDRTWLREIVRYRMKWVRMPDITSFHVSCIRQFGPERDFPM
jgi:hypothetical protein